MMMRFDRVLFVLLLLVSARTTADETTGEQAGSAFTGERLTLLYVSDVGRSVSFYKSIGFIHDYFYDYEKDRYVLEWTEDYPPEYAEMIQGDIRLGLTTSPDETPMYGGGVRHYFIVADVQAHFEMIDKKGIRASPHEVEHRPWMDFVTIADPDNHQIVFGTKNQTYYDEVRKVIDGLRPGNRSSRDKP